MAVMLTEKAASKVKEKLQEAETGGQVEPGAFLRVAVVGGGCSGFEYRLGFDKKFDEAQDAKFDHHGVTMVVDKKSALYLDGTTVDYYESMEKEGFTFDNPNAVKSCGCGQSFQV